MKNLRRAKLTLLEEAAKKGHRMSRFSAKESTTIRDNIHVTTCDRCGARGRIFLDPSAKPQHAGWLSNEWIIQLVAGVCPTGS
jgi:hypothetical protein